MEKINIIEYDETGRILQTGLAPLENVEVEFALGKLLLQGEADPLTQYVADGAIAPRPPNSTVLDGMVLRNLPAPCRLIVDGVEYDCPDAECALSFSLPGLHHVVVDAFPAQQAVFEVTT
ncbi:hypothetical protein VL04_17675 [Chromobacterium violaceum]|uniref:hypothetical protein n=1 Tax=Chromobacterium violaceum TaxID=536 RepID=UPI0006544FC2|nr:hypothetical protein [Chromobacterium violaceum]KMN48789.1 hypothetical protein VK93_14940 [Chromobacterium violaceum]KMN87884.1 hypothetical protein VL02_00935 [Chromobacterium violaceum]KMN89113.1 hypothetical protein VL04_17675 [Chromobacterium violaceum]KMO05487.1 hypothetical protein VL16_02920 [Chromobacterium violaceum]